MKLHFLAHFCWRATIHSVASQVGFAGRSAVAEATSPDPKTKVSSAGFGRLWRWHHSASYSLYGFIYGFIRILRSRSLSVFQKHDQERFWTILDNNPGTSHLNRSFSKEWGVPWVFGILQTLAFVPEGGIDMSPFDQPRTVSTSKSSGGGGRWKQSRDNMPTYTQKSCVHPQLQLLTYTHSGRNPWVHTSRHALASKNIYMKIRMQTNHYINTHTHASANLQMRRCPQLAKFCTNCSWTALFHDSFACLTLYQNFAGYLNLPVPEGGIDMSPFDQPQSRSNSKSSGGGRLSWTFQNWHFRMG